MLTTARLAICLLLASSTWAMSQEDFDKLSKDEQLAFSLGWRLNDNISGGLNPQLILLGMESQAAGQEITIDKQAMRAIELSIRGITNNAPLAYDGCKDIDQAGFDALPDKHKLAFSYGLRSAPRFLSIGLSLEQIRAGYESNSAGGSLEIDHASLSSHLRSKEMAVRKKAEQEHMATQRKAEQEHFAALRKQEGVVFTDSGIAYEVLEAGDEDGVIPTARDTVIAHYTGILLDESVFDCSREKGQPASFALNGVIQGWTETLTMMSEGARWRIHIPARLGYGARPKGSIPTHSTLIFDVELLRVVR